MAYCVISGGITETEAGVGTAEGVVALVNVVEGVAVVIEVVVDVSEVVVLVNVVDEVGLLVDVDDRVVLVAVDDALEQEATINISKMIAGTISSFLSWGDK